MHTSEQVFLLFLCFTVAIITFGFLAYGYNSYNRKLRNKFYRKGLGILLTILLAMIFIDMQVELFIIMGAFLGLCLAMGPLIIK